MINVFAELSEANGYTHLDDIAVSGMFISWKTKTSALRPQLL